MKKIIGLILSITILLGITCVYPVNAASTLSDSQITEIVEDYLSVVGTKRYWNAGIRNNRELLKQQIDNGDYLSATTTSPCKANKSHLYDEYGYEGCSSNVFTGVNKGISQCAGFGDYIEYLIFRTTDGSSWKKHYSVDANFKFRPGDLIRTRKNSSSKHTMVVYKVVGNDVHIIEGNYGGRCHINTRVLEDPHSFVNYKDSYVITPPSTLRIDSSVPYEPELEVSSIPVKLYIGGEKIKSAVKPKIVNGRTVLPLRAAFEEIGANVEWDGATQTVTATKGDIVAKLTIGSNVMLLNGKQKILDVAPYIENGRTMVPVRACAEAFNLQVDWDGATYTARIRKEVSVISEVIYSDGSWTKYTYDEAGNVTYSEDSNGGWTKYTYDETGNVTYSEDSSGFWTKYTHDEWGNLTYTESSYGHCTKYAYDEAGNLTYAEYFYGGWAKYTYDEFGNQTYYEGSNGDWAKYTYDENGNNTYIKFSDGNWEKCTYDETGNLTYYENSFGIKTTYTLVTR